MAHWVGLVVSVLAYFSDNLSSNPAGYKKFLREKTNINEKRPGLAHIKKKWRLMKTYTTKAL